MDWLNNLFGSTGLTGLFGSMGNMFGGTPPSQFGSGMVGALNAMNNIAPGTGAGRGINTNLSTGATSDVGGSGVPNPMLMNALANKITGGGMGGGMSGLQNSLGAMGKPGSTPGGATPLGMQMQQPNYAGTGPNPNLMGGGMGGGGGMGMQNPMMGGGSGGSPLGPAGMNPLLMMLRARMGGGMGGM